MKVAIYARQSSENQSEKSIDDLRKKTMRGLEGQKLREFSAGENVYGYHTKPVGELKQGCGGKRLGQGGYLTSRWLLIFTLQRATEVTPTHREVFLLIKVAAPFRLRCFAQAKACGY